MLIKDNRIINVTIVTTIEKQNIISYLDQIISGWINKRPNEWFNFKDLLDFYLCQHENWNGTPLQVLYDNYIKKGKNHEQALDLGGKAAGKLLKETVHKRQEKFDTKKEYLRKYKLV